MKSLKEEIFKYMAENKENDLNDVITHFDPVPGKTTLLFVGELLKEKRVKRIYSFGLRYIYVVNDKG